MTSRKLKNFVEKGLFFKSVVEDGSDLVMVVDFSGIIQYHNKSSVYYGYKAKELIGKNFFDFIHPDESKKVKKGFLTSTKKEFNRAIEFQFKGKDGHYRSFEFNSLNLKHREGVEGLILDCRDITQRKKDAEALVHAQQAKEQFMANISHELRTPINGISGIASLLAEGTPPEESKTYLNAIRSAAENLKVIINDILDISSIESGKLTFEKIGFNLDDLLSGLEGTFTVQAKSKNVELVFDLAPNTRRLYYGDPVRLNQILINLIGNALKFTQRGSVTLTVGLHSLEKEKCELKFEVKDTGIGIAADKLSRIFERFSQADSSVTRKYGGTGLGLTIVKQLVELQKGSIKVNSLEGVGSVFSVILPYEITSDLKPLARKKIASKVAASNELLKKLHVLLVEDNDINQLYAGSILKSWGIKYDVAENGFIALEKLKSIRPDLILMDVQMPVMDGFEASRSIRQGDNSICKIPIIALTAHTNQSIIDRCTESGMNDYIPKPFTPGELQEILIRYTGRKSEPKKTVVEKSSRKETQPAPDFDLTYLIQVSNHDRSFISQILNSFLTNAESTLQALRTDIKDGDTNRIAGLVHKIKPSLTMIGAEAARQHATALENLASDTKAKSKIKSSTKEFCGLLEKTITGLRSLDLQKV